MKIQDSDIRNLIQKAVETSYVSTIVLDSKNIELISKYRDCVNDLTKDKEFLSCPFYVQNWILTSMVTSHYVNAETINIHYRILDSFWSFFSDFIFPGKKIKKAIEKIQEYIDTAKKEYDLYVQNHESSIKEVQAQIDRINKCKPLMKDYILKKVVTKLHELGIDCLIDDYPMEFIDYRVFNLNHEFDYINEQFKKLKNSQYAHILENFPIMPMFPINLIVPILVSKKLKEVENNFQQIKKQTEFVFEKMRSDNQKIKNLSLSLDNIAKIYTEINSKFIPVINDILELISQKYQNDIAKIPVEVLCLLRTTTKILKELAERRIIPQDNSNEIVESIIEANNDISVAYENLKKAFSEAA